MNDKSGMAEDEIWYLCDRCGEKVYPEDAIDEDNLIYHKSCYEKLLEKE